MKDVGTVGAAPADTRGKPDQFGDVLAMTAKASSAGSLAGWTAAFPQLPDSSAILGAISAAEGAAEELDRQETTGRGRR